MTKKGGATEQDIRLALEIRRRNRQRAKAHYEKFSKARSSLAFYFYLARGLTPLKHQVKVMNTVTDFLRRCWQTPKHEVTKQRVLNLNLPPGAGKSSIITTTTPPWILGNRPWERIGVISAKADLADLFELVAKRDIESSELYRAVFPNDDARPDYRYSWARGRLFVKGLPKGQISPSLSASSLFGTVMGKRFSVIIIDDGQDQLSVRTPAGRQKTWSFVENTVLSRAPMWCPVINVQQRLHAEDLTGMFKKYYDAETVAIPALDENDESYWESEYTTEALKHKRRNRPYQFALWYQQDDSLEGGEQKIFKKSTFAYHEGVVPYGWRIQSWDTAAKAEQQHDFSAYVDAIITADLDVYLLDFDWKRLEPDVLEQSVKGQYDSRDVEGVMQVDNQTVTPPLPGLVAIEDASSGQVIAQNLRKLTKLPIVAVKPVHDKVTRARSVQGWFNAGKVYFPKYHPRRAKFESFLLNFPQQNNQSKNPQEIPDGEDIDETTLHDDPVDALVQLLVGVINDSFQQPKQDIRMDWV